MAYARQAVQTLLDWTAVNAAAVQKSSELDLSAVAGLSLLRVEIEWGPVATTTPTKGCEIRIECNLSDSGENDGWFSLTSFVTGLTAATQFALDGAEAAGSTLIEEAATAGLVVSEYVIFAHATIANTEVHRVIALVLNTTFTILDGLDHDHVLGENYYTKAERFSADIEGSPGARYRVVVDNNYQAGTATNGRARVRAREMRVT